MKQSEFDRQDLPTSSVPRAVTWLSCSGQLIPFIGGDDVVLYQQICTAVDCDYTIKAAQEQG